MQTILFVHNSNDLYGADIILLNLIAGLDRSRFEALVILPEDVRHIRRLSARLDADGVPYVFLPLGVIRRKYMTFLGIRRLAFDAFRGTAALCKLIRAKNVVLVHSNTMTVFSGALAAKLTGRPHLWHIHEITTANKWIRRAFHAVVCHSSDAIVAVSNAVRDHILRDQPSAASRCHTIYNGIDLKPFTFPHDGFALRAELDIPTSAMVVGMVGRVSPIKGQAVFLEAARRVLKDREDVYFVAIGGVFDNEHHHMESFQKQLRSYGLDRFTICDFRQDIPEVLAAFDLFVVPSILPDSFPTVVIEAMASGRVVVGSACGGLPEMIIDGRTGALFPPGDAIALGEVVLSLLDDRKRLQSMGNAAKEHALKSFQISRFVHEFETLYSKLISPVQSSTRLTERQRG